MSSQKKKKKKVRVVRVAVIGLGDMGRKHAAIHRAMDGVEVVAAVDVMPNALREYAAEHGLTPFHSVEALADAVRKGELALDAVDVCTPNAFHAQAAIAALNLGLDVLCEKPLAHTVDAARDIAEAASISDGHLMVGFLYRHHPVVAEWLAEVRKGLGALVFGKVEFLRRDGVPDRPAFKNRELTGGGPAVDLLPHALAVVLDAVGLEKPTTVTAAVSPHITLTGEDVEDAAFGVYGFGTSGPGAISKGILSVATSWRANLPAGAPDERASIELIGTRGGFAVELPLGAEAAQPGYEAELASFVARVRGEEPWPEHDVDHALLVQRMVAALYRSAKNGSQPARIV